MQLWEIFVPTEKRIKKGKNPYFSLKHHRVFDRYVQDLCGGLSILPKSKGKWVSPDKEVFHEENIGVLIACSEEQIEKIAEFTLKHYDQLAVFYYLVSSDVRIKYKGA